MTSLIKTENIVKTYNTGDSLFYDLNGVSLSVKYGEFVAIMGSSGSVKSNFMNFIDCLDVTTSGYFFLDGCDVSKLSKDNFADSRKL